MKGLQHFIGPKKKTLLESLSCFTLTKHIMGSSNSSSVTHANILTTALTCRPPAYCLLSNSPRFISLLNLIDDLQRSRGIAFPVSSTDSLYLIRMSEVSRLNAMKNAIQKPFWLSHHLLRLEQKNKKQMLIQIQTTLWLVFCLLVKLAVIHREKKRINFK